MTDLIERLEAATGPCRELDRAIAEALGWSGICSPNVTFGNRPDGSRWIVPRFTASIDDALTLVPEGWGYTLCDPRDGKGRPWAKLFPPNRLAEVQPTFASTTRLALCSAALKARGGR